MSANFGFILLSTLITIFILWLISKTRRGGLVVDSIKLKFPIFGSLINQAILNKFCKTFGILIGAGVPVLDSTKLLSKVVDNRVFEEATIEASNYIREGYNISTAMRRTE